MKIQCLPRKWFEIIKGTEKTLCRAVIMAAALLAGCISGNGTGDTTDANVEAENIAKTVASWLEPYKSSLGIKTERDGDSIYVRGRFGVLPSVFNMLDIVFLIHVEEREVVCFAYLPTTVSEGRRRAMAEFIFRGEWEYGISTASMVMEEGGRVRCQAWSPFESFAHQPRETQWRLMGAIVDKLWSFSEGVAAVSLGVDPAAAASGVKRIAAFEGLDEAAHLEKAADADTKAIIERCFEKDSGITSEESSDEWLNKLSGKGGDVSVGTIMSRFEEVVRDIGGRYDLLPYALIVQEGVVWNVCKVPEECPEEMRGEVAALLMKINEGLKYAQFGMDFDTGKIWSHYAVPVSVIPEWDERPPGNLYGAFIKMKTIQSVAENSEALHSAFGKAVMDKRNYKENAEFVKKFLDDNDWHYEMTEHDTCMVFAGGVGGFKGLYNSFRFLMFVGEDEVQNYATFPVHTKDKLPQVAEFIARANHGLKYGAFEMDYGDGEVRFHLAFPMTAVRADSLLLPTLLALPPKMLDQYAKGFMDVLMDIKTPADAVKDCEEDRR